MVLLTAVRRIDDIGATNLAQLKENIDAYSVKISDEIVNGINAIHAEIVNPGQQRGRRGQ